nr:hypothetical protein [Psychromonas antarctica]
MKKFNLDELLFNEEETVLILKFIFKRNHSLIDRIAVNDALREFAQGLLLTAVDQSYGLGFVDSLLNALLSNPRAGIKKILIKFGKKAMKHWFKHATVKDLTKIQIYDRVCDSIEYNFVHKLQSHANGVAKLNDNNFGVLALHPFSNNKKVWA